MERPNQFTLPVIHINGTGVESLQKEYENARLKLQDAIKSFHEATCHPRDFYPVEGSWERAREERNEMRERLNEVLSYLEAWESQVFLALEQRASAK